MDITGIKTWLLTNLAMILGVALVLIGLYASWLHFVTVPRLEGRVASAEAASKVWEANFGSCQTANAAMVGAVERQTASIQTLAEQGQANQSEVAAILLGLSRSTAGVRAQLRAFTPDPSKTDCENAAAELKKFKIERGR